MIQISPINFDHLTMFARRCVFLEVMQTCQGPSPTFWGEYNALGQKDQLQCHHRISISEGACLAVDVAMSLAIVVA